MDFGTVWNATTQSGDWLLAGPDLASDAGFNTAVIISLMTDRLAAPDDVIPDGSTDRRGTWMDMPVDPTVQPNGPPDYMGCRWWLLKRAKATEATRQAFMAMAAEALQWMLDDGVAASVQIQTGWVARGFLAGTITIARVTGTTAGQTVNHVFDVAWNATLGASASPAGTGGTVYTAPPAFLAYPDPPLALAVVSVTATAAALSWAAATTGGAPATYVAQVSPHGAGTWTTCGTVTAPATGATATGLTSSTAYDFRVFAVNATGAGAASAIATASTAVNAPNAPTALSAAAGSPAYSVAALAWTASATDSTHNAATSYTVQYQLVGAGSWTTFATGVTGTTESVTGLAHNTGYNFQVIAVNAGGNATSSDANLTTATAAPNAPTALSAAAGSPAYSVAALSWTASATDGTHDAAATYTVQYRTVGAGSWTTFATGVTGTTESVTGLAHGTAYNFQVLALNAGGTATSSTANLTTGLAAPNAPTALSASAGSPAYSVASLSWTAPATDGTHDAAATYTVQYQTVGAGSWTTFATGVTGTTESVTGLAHDTAYNFQVSATNSGGTGAYSSSTSLTTDYAPPNVPVISSVAPVPDGTTTKLTASWAASVTDGTHDAATSYNLRYSVHAANTWTTITGATSATLITGLTTGTSYDVQVQAANGSTTSPSAWSASTTVSTYATVMVWAQTGPNPWTHSLGGQPVNVSCTPNPSTSSTGGVNFTWSTSATVNNDCAPTLDRYSRGSGSSTGDNGYPFATNKWGVYLTSPATTGTYYIWATTNVGDGCIVGAAVTVS